MDSRKEGRKEEGIPLITHTRGFSESKEKLPAARTVMQLKILAQLQPVLIVKPLQYTPLH
jgi:hypothetical protein